MTLYPEIAISTSLHSSTKAQVQHMITRLLKLPSTPQEDASDALAAALCHISGAAVRQATGAQAFATGRLK